MDTFPKILLKNADSRSSSPAIRVKRLGIWKEFSWSDASSEVALAAHAFSNLGIKRDDKVAILSSNQPEMITAITAIQALGAVPVVIYPYLIDKMLASALNDADCQYAFIHDQQEADAILDLGDQHSLKKVIHVSSRGMASYDKKLFTAFASLTSQSDAQQARDFLRAKVNETQAGDTAFIFFSSGTDNDTLNPTPISHENALAVTQAVASATQAKESDDVLLANSLALLPSMIFGYMLPHYAGLCANCPESSETVLENMREISPTILFAPPHVYKYISGLIHNRISMSEGFTHKLYRKYVDENSGPLSAWLGEILIYAPIKDLYGMSHLRCAISSGSIISDAVDAFYRTLGVSIQQMYGTVEASGCVSLQSAEESNTLNVGKPIEGCEVKVENGEILCRGSNVVATQLQDGWFHTGDSGSLNEKGEIVLEGRKSAKGQVKNQQYMADVLESKAKSSAYIKDAAIFGDRKEFLSALIVVEEDITANWADRNGLRYAGYESLVSKEEVAELVRKELANLIGPSKFVLLPRDFSMDTGEIAYTTKLNRRNVAENFTPILEAIYQNKNSATYSDSLLTEDKQVAIHQV